MRPVHYLGIFIPVAVALELAHADPVFVFSAAALGVIPCAAVMGESTEAIAARTGPGIGGLLNVTFGNAPELIIAFFALIFPAIFQLIHGGGLPAVGDERVDFGSDLEKLSFGVAIVLLISYVAGLIFSLKTHRDVFNPYGDDEEQAHHWSVGRAAAYLAVAAVAVGVMSEILVGSISEASEDIGLSEFFVGVFIVAIVGNAAEHWVAVLVAAKDKMDLAVNIALGSSAQIALFVAPVLVLLSFAVGPEPMALVFNGYELGALLFAVLIANLVTQEGESNWFEGVQLLSLYAVFGLVFYFA